MLQLMSGSLSFFETQCVLSVRLLSTKKSLHMRSNRYRPIINVPDWKPWLQHTGV